ncbi:MAG: ABC-F family ATP-binding cassette domain-containing protein [Hyphomicrobiales bacterium]|nr:ABC-F family ATP-binding cassette domain-containing protein [Hyphomicrobiales bacterium]
MALRSVTYVTPDGLTLLDDLSLTFGCERTGLVGRNGIGKSTLFRLIAGELAPASGTIERSGIVGFLRQTVQTDKNDTIADAFGAAAGLARLDRLDKGRGSLTDAAEADWTLPARMADALSRVQLPNFSPSRQLASLSGGQRTRATLAVLLFSDAVILLDEPTNHLDLDSTTAIETALCGYNGALLVASHDPDFLDAIGITVQLELT